ncbi:hypothetical protein BU24DRAFT_423550 [Aaosphaeria arxii CBS 175.79]|uniref:non-specific serine/threonine protein kinase n=1 Tax=Aaosphaeria arxii CBS 175.79 TaxID=1450172 RepID=A0A6A5XQS0_9PLEO|nr:uncharacterized protein BU24DRAFT_423550 [Aaosphaeria arxii CBS 175.79]KAF2014644.1 hypothetical protein BU24DRAFT_423550 [Aaosphaeria arxii CBS 175.79]
MPPKNVYGKRTKTTTAVVAAGGAGGFARFICTPEKAAREDVDADVDVEGLEVGLRGLSVAGGGVEGEEDRKGSERSRKALESRDVNAETKRKKKGARKEKKSGRAEGVEVVDENVGVEDGAVKSEDSSSGKDAGRTNVATSEGDVSRSKAGKTPVRSKSHRSKSRSRKQLRAPVAEISEDDMYTTYVKSLLQCSERREIVSFDDWSSQLDSVVDVSKIAEASFSEVYRLSVKTARTDCSSESVLKLVALKTPENMPLPSELKENDRPRRKGDFECQLQKEREEREEQDMWKSSVDDVNSEVRLLQNLNDIPGFTTFRDLTILKGRPSSSFSKAWKSWNKSRPKGKKSEFPDPSKKTSYQDDQLWAVIEMQDAGSDCGKVFEAGGISTIWEVWDIFWSVCISVAKAEQTCEFEHRDLHMDNICVRSSTDEADLTNRVVQKPLKRKLGFTGLETTVIDYTLSRANMIKTPSSQRTSLSSSASPIFRLDQSDQGQVAYLDLNKDPALFTGDAEEEYQYEIYRYMRGAVFYGDPLKSPPSSQPTQTPSPTPNNEDATQNLPVTPRRSPRKAPHPGFLSEPPADIWRHFHPKTNLIWTHFILHRLLENLHSHGNTPASKSNDAIMHNVVGVDEADASKVWKKAVMMHKILLKVAQKLDPKALGRREGGLGSCAELIVLALEARWLAVGDVEGP